MNGGLSFFAKPRLASVGRFLSAVVCCLCTDVAFGYTYRLSPTTPNAGQPVQIVEQGAGYLDNPGAPGVSVSGNSIKIVFGPLNDEVIPGKPMVPYTAAFNIGSFAAGTYAIDFYGTIAPGGDSYFIAAQQLVVVGQTPAVPSGTGFGNLLLGALLIGIAMQRIGEFGKIRLCHPSAQAHE